MVSLALVFVLRVASFWSASCVLSSWIINPWSALKHEEERNTR